MENKPQIDQKARKAAIDLVFGEAKIASLAIDDPVSGVDYASIGEEYALPELFWAEIRPEDKEAPITRMLIDSSDGMPTCSEIRLRAADSSGVSPDALRMIQTGAYLREVVAHGAVRFSREKSKGQQVMVDGVPAWITPLEPGERWTSVRKLRTEGNERMRRAKRAIPVTDEQIEVVAQQYLEAVEQSDKAPVATLAKTYNVSRSTIHRWLEKARKAELLGPATQGRAG